MSIENYKIDSSSFVSDIVAHDYRTADVFRKYDIEFCCGAKWPLDIACQSKGLETEKVLKELKQSTRHIASNAVPDFDEWNIDFLVDYILNVHHLYLKKALPDVNEYVIRFLEGHKQKYPELAELENVLNRLMKEIPPHMLQEEEIIFPYIKHIYHAWHNKESYGNLLVRTLRKPVEGMMKKEHESVSRHLQKMRVLTNDYRPPVNACVTHKVAFAKLNELDSDLVQHIHIESNILFPRAIAMEKELLLDK